MAICVTAVWTLAGISSLITHDVAPLSIATSVLVIFASGLMVAWSRSPGNGKKNGAS